MIFLVGKVPFWSQSVLSCPAQSHIVVLAHCYQLDLEQFDKFDMELNCRPPSQPALEHSVIHVLEHLYTVLLEHCYIYPGILIYIAALEH